MPKYLSVLEVICVRTYVKAEGPPRPDESSESLKDEDKVQECEMKTTETTTKQEMPTHTHPQRTRRQPSNPKAHELDDATTTAGTSGVLTAERPRQTGKVKDTTGSADGVAKRPHGDVGNESGCSREGNTDKSPQRPPTLRHPSINVTVQQTSGQGRHNNHDTNVLCAFVSWGTVRRREASSRLVPTVECCFHRYSCRAFASMHVRVWNGLRLNITNREGQELAQSYTASPMCKTRLV